MKKTALIIAGVLILFFVGIFSVSISTGSFFFTTKYFRTPLKAYNDFGGHFDPILGDTSAEKELLFVPLDEENGLFVAQVNDNRFIVCEMAIKNDKYASKGRTLIYDIDEMFDDYDRNETSVLDGSVCWKIVSIEPEAETATDVASVESFIHGSGKTFYLVIYKK